MKTKSVTIHGRKLFEEIRYLLFVVYSKNMLIFIYLEKYFIIIICFSGWLSKPGRILDSHALSSFETKQY